MRVFYKRRILASIIAILAVLAAVPNFPSRVEGASTGTICIAQVTDTRCPASPPVFNGPITSPNTLLRVPVMINNTAPFSVFSVTLNSSDLSKLKPYGVDLAGSIMPAGSFILAECVGGVLIAGSACVPTDNPATVQLAIAGPLGFLSLQGTTGLLFTAIFSITGTTLPGGVKINYQNGCDTKSSSNGNFCVSFANGTIVPVPEALQNGGFDNSNTATLPSATLSTTTTNLGQSLTGAPTHALPTATFTLTSQNGFNTSIPTLTLATSVNGTGIRPTVSLSTSSITLSGLPQSFTQTGSVSSTVPAGVYIATVTATYQTQDLFAPVLTTSSLSATFSLPVTVSDYSLSVSPSTVAILSPGSQSVKVTIAPKAGFNTLIQLSVTIPPAASSAGIGATFSSTTIPGGSGTSTLTITTTASTPSGTFILTVNSSSTLNGFTRVHFAPLTVSVGPSDFQISANPTSLSAAPFYGMTSTITVTSLNGFTGQVALSFTATPTSGLTCNLSSTIVTLNPTTSGTSNLSCSGIVGTYTVNITGSGGGHSHSTSVSFIVFAPGQGTVIAVDPYATIDLARSSKTITITVNLTRSSPINGFSVVLAYDYRVLHASSLNYSTNVFAQSPYSRLIVSNCLDSFPQGNLGLCSSNDGPGITSFAMTILGGTTLNNTSGSLFKLTFNVNTTAPVSSQIQIKSAVLSNGQIDPLTGKPQIIPVSTFDGYYTSLSCGGAPCTPPKVDFSWSPLTPMANQVVTFLGNNSLPSPNALITDYYWTFGDSGLQPYRDSGTNSTTAYLYQYAGRYPVTLKITDSNGLRWSKTVLVSIVAPIGFAISAPQQIIINPGEQLTLPNAVIVTSFDLNGTVTLGAGGGSAELSVDFNPLVLRLRPGSTLSSSLTVVASSSILPGRYGFYVSGSAAGLVRQSVLVIVLVPVSSFSLTIQPNTISLNPGSSATILVSLFNTSINATVNLSVQNPSPAFNISFLPPSLTISPGRSFLSNMILTPNTGIQPGNYVILVSATTGSITHTAPLFVTITSPPDFQIQTYPPTIQVFAGSSGFLSVNVQRSPCCTNPSPPFNVTLSVTISPLVPNGPRVSLRDTVLTIYGGSYTFVIVMTGPNTPLGNYTVTVTGGSGSLGHSASSTLVVLPPPVLRVTPSSGPVGTKVDIRGSGFVSQFGGYPQSHQFWVTFDDQFLGEAFTLNSSFIFTFNVPDAQPGPHLIKALDFYTGVNATAPFQVLAEPGALTLSIDTGTIYFPGDTATAYVLVSQNGLVIQAASIQIHLTLIKPDGSKVSLTVTGVSGGLFKAVYAVPTSGPIGTYALLATAQGPNGHGTALRTFEVKPSWLSSNGKALASATGAIGAIGLVAFAWKKGYLKRKESDETGL